jgi:predicted DsbA family dithiol-disulfide isomerase
MATVRLYFDYIDPGSLLLERRLMRAVAERGVSVERVPFEVRPPPEALIDPASDAWLRYWAAIAPEVGEEGLELRSPTPVPWTRKAHELGLHAKEKGLFEEVHGVLFRSLLEEGRDLGRVDVLVELAGQCGLEPGETKAALDVDHHTSELERLRSVGEAEGVRGVPTLVFGDRVLEGIPSIPELNAFLEERVFGPKGE